jgi:AcrR family transcriptional regulator
MEALKSRRQENVEATKNALLDAAQELFVRDGYTATSLDDVVRLARVTKGALYHHFANKLALFEAVFERVDLAMVERVLAVVEDRDDPWERAMLGLDAFLDACLDPSFRRIVLQEGVPAMGAARYKEVDRNLALGLVIGLVQQMVDEGIIEPVPVELASRVIYATLGEAANEVAIAEDPVQARAESSELLRRLLSGLRVA